MAQVVREIEPVKEQKIEPEVLKVRESAKEEVLKAEEEIVPVIEKAVSPIEEPVKGDFGPIFTEFKGDAQGAIKHLTDLKNGEAAGALYHQDIGEIDLVWGKEGTPENDYKDGYGLAKIVKKHAEVLNNLQEIVSNAEIKSQSANRIMLNSQDHKAAISLNWYGKEKKWLLSAYKISDTSAEGSIHGSSNIGSAPSPALQDVPVNSNIDRKTDKVNPQNKQKLNNKAKGKFNPETDTLSSFVRKKGGIKVNDTYMLKPLLGLRTISFWLGL